MANRLRGLSVAVWASVIGLSVPALGQGLGMIPSTKPATAPAAIAVPSNVAALKDFPPLPADPIERPAFRGKAHPITKSMTSATAMMVRREPDGGLIGMTSDVIATVSPESRKGNEFSAVFIAKDSGQADVGDEMKVSFNEAVRAVRVRYPQWEPGKIEFNFGEKYTPHDGGSAGTCFAALMLSELEGFDIDPKMAVTGDISVNWKVLKIGGVAAKIRGATADHCLYAAIPEDNAEHLSDMALVYGDASLRDIQIFSIDTLQQAVALLRTDRSPQVTEAMAEFAALQPKLKSGRAALVNPENQKALEQVLHYAPNHESAKRLLAIGRGTAPKTLSPSFALNEIIQTIEPYFPIMMGKEPVSRSSVTSAMTLAANKRLNQIRPITPTNLQALLRDCTAIINTCESMAQKQPIKIDVLAGHVKSFSTDIHALSSDKDLIEKLMRDGF